MKLSTINLLIQHNFMTETPPFELNAPCQTKPDKAFIFWGWSDFEYKGKIIQITTLPLVDSDTLLFARPTYADSEIIAKRENANMMTADLVEEIYLKGFVIKPAIQPAGPKMGNRQYALNHDIGVWKQLGAWDSKIVVANSCKDWVTPTLPGRACNFGWIGEGIYRTPRGLKCWQPVGKAHGNSHYDYSQCLRLWRE